METEDFNCIHVRLLLPESMTIYETGKRFF